MGFFSWAIDRRGFFFGSSMLVAKLKMTSLFSPEWYETWCTVCIAFQMDFSIRHTIVGLIGRSKIEHFKCLEEKHQICGFFSVVYTFMQDEHVRQTSLYWLKKVLISQLWWIIYIFSVSVCRSSSQKRTNIERDAMILKLFAVRTHYHNSLLLSNA